MPPDDPQPGPIRLSANQPPKRFYRGGEAIAKFRDESSWEEHTPEDWVGSTTSVRNRAPEGMTRLPDGRLLASAIEEDPVSFLGLEHAAAFGSDTKLLVKLLDAGERLPIHAHPDSNFAARHVGAAHGKAEAWYVLSPGVVYLGLTQDVDADELLEIVVHQRTEFLLGLMHKVHVNENDTVYVPPGMLHAIGAGVLLAEVQEPEDLSILLEWNGFRIDGAADGHLGLGFDRALQAVERSERSLAEVLALVRRGVADGPTLADGAAEYFRLDRVTGSQEFPPSFAIVIAVSGHSLLTPANAMPLRLHPGSTTLVPHAAGTIRMETSGSVLVARPPQSSIASTPHASCQS